MADAHELFASLRLAVHSLLRTGTLADAAPLLPLMPGLEAQLLTEVAPRLVNDAKVHVTTNSAAQCSYIDSTVASCLHAAVALCMRAQEMAEM